MKEAAQNAVRDKIKKGDAVGSLSDEELAVAIGIWKNPASTTGMAVKAEVERRAKAKSAPPAKAK